VLVGLAALLFRYGYLALVGVVVVDTDQFTFQRRSFFRTRSASIPAIVFFQPKLRTVQYHPINGAMGMGMDPVTNHRSWCWHLNDVEIELNTTNLVMVEAINSVLQEVSNLECTPLHLIEVDAPAERQFPGLSRKLLLLPIFPLFFVYTTQSGGSIQHQFLQVLQNNTTGVVIILVQLYLVCFGLFTLYVGISIAYLMPISSVDLEVSYRVTRNLMLFIGYSLICLGLLVTSIFLSILYAGLLNYVGSSAVVLPLILFLHALFSSATIIAIPVLLVAFIVGIWWSGVLKQRNQTLSLQFERYADCDMSLNSDMM